MRVDGYAGLHAEISDPVEYCGAGAETSGADNNISARLLNASAYFPGSSIIRCIIRFAVFAEKFNHRSG